MNESSSGLGVDAVKLCQCFLICGPFALNSALKQFNPEECLDCMRNLFEKSLVLLPGISLLVPLLASNMYLT